MNNEGKEESMRKSMQSFSDHGQAAATSDDEVRLFKDNN
jgi:hypothetical protein